jgi:hypothetical protein
MWSDTLLAAERAHLTRLLAWGAASVVAGSVVLLLLAARRGRSPLLLHFAIQTLVWGAIDLALALAARRGLAQRDVSGATRLDRLIWFNNGLDVGYVAVGLTLAIVGWLLGRRLGLIGGGIGVVVQGLALLVLDLRFAADLARML